MMKKLLDKIRIMTIPICFVMFMGLNYMFSILYCGKTSMLSWLFSGCWALIFCGIIALLPTLGKRISMIFIVTFFSLTCILHAVMFNLFGNFFAFSDLSYTGDGLAFFSFSYLKVRKLLLLTAIGCIAVSIFLAVNLKKKKYIWKQGVIGLALVIVGISGITVQHNKILADIKTEFAWDAAGQSVTDADIYQNMSNKNYAMSINGIYHYLYRSFMITTGLENRLSNGDMYAELDEYYAERAKIKHRPNEVTDLFKGKNAFFIMLESIDTWMLTEEYMPNLYQIQQQSINFSNHYSPLYISAATFNTEFVANTSLISPAKGVDNKAYMNNAFPNSLVNSFNQAGYTSNSFHSSSPTIYNRGAIHKNLGYIKYHDWQDMGMENYMLDSQMVNGYSKMVEGDPFFSFVITYSGHGPYTEESKDISSLHIERAREIILNQGIKASKKDLTDYIYAISHAMETDAFIGGLLDKLEEDNMLEDTVLIFFTDHFGKYMTNHDFVMELKNVDNKDLLCQTPFFIYNQGTPAKNVETISSTVDIVPTVVNLFGLEGKYEYYAGVDVFSDTEHYVIFQGNSWYDGEIYYSADYAGELTEKIMKRNQEISKKMRYSEYIMKCDYFSR